MELEQHFVGDCPGREVHVRVLLADDHEIVLKGLRRVLADQSDWVVCGEARNGREAVALAEEQRPDVIVMDISMPELNGLDATRKIRKLLPQTEVLILSQHFSHQLVEEVLEVGARGYMTKSDAARDLVTAVEALASHRTFLTSQASEALVNRFRMPELGLSRSHVNRLTGREREVVQLLAEGKTSKEVAIGLGISVKTAETHRANIMRKLNLHSVSELTRYAIQNKIVDI